MDRGAGSQKRARVAEQFGKSGQIVKSVNEEQRDVTQDAIDELNTIVNATTEIQEPLTAATEENQILIRYDKAYYVAPYLPEGELSDMAQKILTRLAGLSLQTSHFRSTPVSAEPLVELTEELIHQEDTAAEERRRRMVYCTC
ncbi:hypothetical protein NX059_009271 [Plenodomus lindquistii]|nr:hypothetical protein NX059_009271 [Plenodomus lindquistii]